MAKIQLTREAVVAYGGEEKLNADIKAFQRAIAKHAKSVGVAAPTAPYAVEMIVRQGGGEYEVIKSESDPTPVPVEKTFDELQADAFTAIKWARSDAMVKGGVEYHGTKFDSSAIGLTALMAALQEADYVGESWRQRWRIGAGSFVLIDRGDLRQLIRLIREKHQRAFDNEYRLSQDILHADTAEKLAKIDLTEGWE